jgi:hypothetical protein
MGVEEAGKDIASIEIEDAGFCDFDSAELIALRAVALFRERL